MQNKRRRRYFSRVSRLFAPLDVVMMCQDEGTFVVLLANDVGLYAACRVDVAMGVLSTIATDRADTRITAPLSPTGLNQLLEWQPRESALHSFQSSIPNAETSNVVALPH